MPPNFWRNLWRSLGSLTVPFQVSDTSIIIAAKAGRHPSLQNAGTSIILASRPGSHPSLQSAGTTIIPATRPGSHPSLQSVGTTIIPAARLRSLPSLQSAGSRRPNVCVSRHVAFTPSTLDHLECRRVVRQAETSAFQNFLREMFDGYYELKLSEERRYYGLPPDLPLGNRRLAFDDLVRLNKVATDMWRKMNAERKQKYKQLAKEALRRRSLRLPPDPFRIPPNIRKIHKELMKTKWFVRVKARTGNSSNKLPSIDPPNR